MRTPADEYYKDIITRIINFGDRVETRNHETLSCIDMCPIVFSSFPLVTLRKIAVSKAISEMEWFLSGDPVCPENLRDWWQGQLDAFGMLKAGYGEQLTKSSGIYYSNYNQIAGLIDGIIKSPNGRRHIISTWNPADMANITAINGNPNTPTNCHNTLSQFFVRNGSLYLTTYQRSCDVLLGLPHSWVQTWALLVYIAARTNHKVGTMTWLFGDAHIYTEESHMTVAYDIASHSFGDDARFVNAILEYQTSIEPESVPFYASDFSYYYDAEPITKVRPKLL